MQKAIATDDLVAEISRHVHGRHTLTTLARTTRVFFHAATNELWRDEINFFHLLQTFGPTLFRIALTHHEACTNGIGASLTTNGYAVSSNVSLATHRKLDKDNLHLFQPGFQSSTCAKRLESIPTIRRKDQIIAFPE